MKSLELLAPARDKNIGIAAIDCGADAVYIAGPALGNRRAAGNSIEDIAELCTYAHRFGARVYMTVNTIIYGEPDRLAGYGSKDGKGSSENSCSVKDGCSKFVGSPAAHDDSARVTAGGSAATNGSASDGESGEWEMAHAMMLAAQEAGVDAFIFREERLLEFSDIHVPMHASTQCSIRTAERARHFDRLGCERIILERGLSLQQVREICSAVNCEVEFFVHGALCVCYSGECRLSEYLDGRSADRGDCIQACRSLYDLVDGSGQTLLHDKALLSLKDFKLLDSLEELADAGVCSFKIEGRLKNESYVRNVVREYSIALDSLVQRRSGEYRRASWGRAGGGFTPDSNKTFNRGYTRWWLDGVRGSWSCMDAPKAMGEFVGTVIDVRPAGCTGWAFRTPDTGKSANGVQKRGSAHPGPSQDIGRGAEKRHFAPGKPYDNGSSVIVSVMPAHPGIEFSSGDGFAFVSKGPASGKPGAEKGQPKGQKPGAVVQGQRGEQGFRGENTGNLGEHDSRSKGAGSRDELNFRGVSTEIKGFRGDRCEGTRIECKWVDGLRPGVRLYRNADVAFEKQIASRPPKREIAVAIDISVRGNFTIELKAVTEDGREVVSSFSADVERAENRERAEAMLREQLGKRAGIYAFSVRSVDAPGPLPLLSASTINSMRRLLAEDLDGTAAGRPTEGGSSDAGGRPMEGGRSTAGGNSVADGMPAADGGPVSDCVPNRGAPEEHSGQLADSASGSLSPAVQQLSNLAFRDFREGKVSKTLNDRDLTATKITAAQDGIRHPLMRTKYCIRYELGMCPKYQGAKDSGPLFLVNNGRHLALHFDCKHCEMTVDI